MKILSINGSPRGKNSNTHKMINEILSGAKSRGAEVENVFLSEMRIEYCRGCFACWLSKDGKCIIKDDMQSLIDNYTQADILMYGTPLYTDNVSALLKTFTDRCLPTVSQYMDKDREGEYKHKENDIRIPKYVIVSNGAFPEPSQFQVVSHYFNRLARNSNTEVIAEIYRGQGQWLDLPKYSRNRIFVDDYFKLLNQVGEEIVVNGALSEETQAKLLEPLGTYDEYVHQLSGYWQKVLNDDF